MNEKAFNTMYALAQKEGYGKSPEEFKTLLNTNEKAFNTMYELAQKEGYKKSADDFKSLLGVGSVEGEDENFTTASDGAQEESTTTSQTESKSSNAGFIWDSGEELPTTPTTIQDEERKADDNSLEGLIRKKVKSLPKSEVIPQQELDEAVNALRDNQQLESGTEEDVKYTDYEKEINDIIKETFPLMSNDTDFTNAMRLNLLNNPELANRYNQDREVSKEEEFLITSKYLRDKNNMLVSQLDGLEKPTDFEGYVKAEGLKTEYLNTQEKYRNLLTENTDIVQKLQSDSETIDRLNKGGVDSFQDFGARALNSLNNVATDFWTLPASIASSAEDLVGRGDRYTISDRILDYADNTFKNPLLVSERQFYNDQTGEFDLGGAFLGAADQVGVLAALALGNVYAGRAAIASTEGKLLTGFAREAIVTSSKNAYTVAGGYAASLESNRRDAKEMGLKDENAFAYTQFMSFLEGATELIMPDNQIFSKEVKDIALKTFAANLSKGNRFAAKEALKSVGEIVGKENLEEILVLAGKTVQTGVIALGNEDVDVALPTLGEVINTVATTTISSGTVPSITNLNKRKQIENQMILKSVQDLEGTKEVVSQFVKKGVVTKADGEKYLNKVALAAEAVQEIPVGFTEIEAAEVLDPAIRLTQLREEAANKKGVAKEILNEEIKTLEDEIRVKAGIPTKESETGTKEAPAETKETKTTVEQYGDTQEVAKDEITRVNELFDNRVESTTRKFDTAIEAAIKKYGEDSKRVSQLKQDKDNALQDLANKRVKRLNTAEKKQEVSETEVLSLDDLEISDQELLELEEDISIEEKTKEAPEVKEQGKVEDSGRTYEIVSTDKKKDGSRVIKAKEVIEVTEDNIDDLQNSRKKPLKVGDKVYGTTKRYTGEIAERIAKDNAVGEFKEKQPKPKKWKTVGTSKPPIVNLPTPTFSSKTKPDIQESTPETVEKELEEEIAQIEKETIDFEQAVLDELASKSKTKDLVQVKGNIYQVAKKSDGTFSVSKMRPDGKLIGLKGDTQERGDAVAEFKKKQSSEEKQNLSEAEELVEQTKKESEDRILKALDKAIENTNFSTLRGQANDVVTVLGYTAANAALRGVRATYKVGVTLKDAIAIQYEKIKATGVTEIEFKKFVLESLKDNPTKKQKTDIPKKEGQAKPDVTPTKPKVVNVDKENEGLTEKEKAKQGFEEYLDSKAKERAEKSKRSKLKAKVRAVASRAKGKTTLANIAKEFSKLNINGVTDKAILKEIERVANELSSSTPKVTTQEISAVVGAVNAARVKEVKPLSERITNNTKKRLNAETPLQALNAEIERQSLVSEVMESEEDIDLNLARELDEELEFTFSGSDVSSIELAKKTRGNLKRASTALQKALDNGDITIDSYNKIKKDLEGAIKEYNNELEKIKKAEKSSFESNRKSVALPTDPTEKEVVKEFLRTVPYDDAAWYAKANEVLDSLNEGVIPYKEMVNLRAYAAYKSTQAKEVASEVGKVNADGKSIETIMTELATKDASQRERNILGLTAKKVWNSVYQPMVASLKRAERTADSLIKGYEKVVEVPSIFRVKSKLAYDKDINVAGLVMHYMREQSLAGQGIKADGILVGNRDIFGILLGNEKAMEAAGLAEKDKEKFRNGNGTANYKEFRQIAKLKEAYEELVDPELGYVDVANISQNSLKTPRQKNAVREAIKLFGVTGKMQEVSNLSRGVDFLRQPFYMPTRRVGGDIKSNSFKPVNMQTVFSSLASSGKEKLTESLAPTIGAFEFNLNKIILDHTAEVSLDYVFSQEQPVTNALLNSVVSQTNDNPVARAIKNDYNASLAFEKERSTSYWLLNTLLGARYAKSLFSPVRSLVEVVSVAVSSMVRQRSTTALTDIFNKTSWSTMNKLEDVFGIKIADFKSAEIERKSLREGLSTETGLVRVGRYTISSPEYITAISNFMPVFRAEFNRLTGESFDMDSFLKDEQYLENYRDQIKEATKVGQEITERYQGSKVKGGTRRKVEVAPKWLNKDGRPVTVPSDSNAGRIIGFFGNYVYREQGEFFTSLKFVTKAIKDKNGQLGKEEVSNLAAVMTNASLYGFLSTLSYLGSQFLLGDDEEKERAVREYDELMTPKGAIKNVVSQIAFLGMSKYGKASRGAGITALSAAYAAADNIEDEKERESVKGLILETLKSQFYVYKPLNIERKYDSSRMLADEMLPAASYLLTLTSDGQKSISDLQEDPNAAVAFELGINLSNLILAISLGTQLPMTRELKKAAKKLKPETPAAEETTIRVDL